MRLTFTPEVAGDYFVIWQAELANTGNNKGCFVRVQLNDTTTIGESINAPIVANAYATASGFTKVTLAVSSQNVDVDFLSQSGTAKIRKVRVLVKRAKESV